ncbi:MAG: Maf family protein [Clostridiales bacterium]|nr:Maf family protein [Clostridiales bacterium]
MKLQAPLILASASPRRTEILAAHGHKHVVIPADADETIADDSPLTPAEVTIYLAELKADTVLGNLDPKDWPDGCRVLGVDTIVYKDRIIGKPVDEADALSILRSLKNGVHEVISGACLIHAVPDNGQAGGGDDEAGGRFRVTERHSFADITTIRLGDYTDEEILAYVRANPPYDKSGSYAIQSEWGRHVLELCGDIENVIGLPYQRLSTYL